MIRTKPRKITPMRGTGYSKKKVNVVAIGILGIVLIVSLTACGATATPTALPQPTSTSAPISAVSTQDPAVSDNTAVATSIPAIPVSDTPTSEMSMSDTSTPEMPMDDTPTVGAQATDTPVPVMAIPATSTAVVDNATPTAANNEIDVQVSLIEWSIQLSQSEVPAGKVVFTVTNEGSMMHNLTVEDDSGVVAKTRNFSPSQSPQTLEVELTPGTYTLICSLPGHAQRGQQTTLVVK